MKAKKQQKKHTANAKKSSKQKLKVPYHRKPDNMNVDEWQFALRKQFAETQKFTVNNTGQSIVFSDYNVISADTQNTYKVSIRSEAPGWNFCSCLDFKTNLLGTCKHIEYLLLSINKNPQKRKILKAGYKPHYTSVYLSYGNSRAVKIRIGTEKQIEFEKLAASFFDKQHTLKSETYFSFDSFLQQAHNLHPDFRCYTDALEFVLNKREEINRNKFVDKALLNENKFFKSIIKADLFPYQKQGIAFLLRKSRCVLADDMGLGKTIQAIAAAEGMKKLLGISKVLIVCPTSLKYQWKSEIEKFTESVLCVIEGNIHEREKQYAGNTFYNICTYNVVGRDLKSINQNDFDLIILDEAQRIKNWQTVTAKNVKKLKSQHCIVLTGTPLENKLEELYSVMQMVNPLLLGALFRFVSAHQICDEVTSKVIGYKDLDKIGVLLKDVLLRRHKRDVLKQLPSRIDKNLFVPMTEKQLDYYNEANEVVVKLVHKWIRFKFLSEGDRQKLLINLNIMRMACNSTFIIDQKTRHDTKVDELLSILDSALVDDECKVVVFSQWERMTRIVGQELEKQNIQYESLHGGVPSKDREKLFDNFRNNPKSKVFLSTDAGGVGLNLQSASLLINLDLPWNPAVLEQRIARIHRMGQKKNVQVINLIAKGTIEEQMLQKLKFKSSLAAGILDNGESTVFLGESKFNELMKQVKEMTDSVGEPAPSEKQDSIVSAPETKTSTETMTPLARQMQLFGEDEQKEKTSITRKTQDDTLEDLFESGFGFFDKLMNVFADENKTEKLLNNIIKTNETTGNTYLQLPLKDRATAEKGLKVFAKLLSVLEK